MRHRFDDEALAEFVDYTIEGDVVVIWAVKHLHRDPEYWQQRRK